MTPDIEKHARREANANIYNFKDLRPSGKTTRDLAGGRTVLLLNDRTGEELTNSENIDHHFDHRSEPITNRFQHEFDSLGAWYYFDEQPSVNKRIALQVLCFPLLVGKCVGIYTRARRELWWRGGKV